MYRTESVHISIPAFWSHLLLSLIVACAAGSIGALVHVSKPLIGLLILAEFASIIVVMLLQKKKVGSYLACYAFVVLSGFVTGALIGGTPEYKAVAGTTAIETLAIFIVLAAVAIKTRTLFLRFGQALFSMLLALLIIEIAMWFIGGSSLTWMVISGIGAFVFCGYILYDIQRAYNKGYAESVPLLVLSVYLDILNLFLNLLNLNAGSRK